MADFQQFHIQEYDLWDLFLHQNQYPYLGRCYAWAKRQDADLVTQMNAGEMLELFGKIIPDWNKAVKQCYHHDRPNLSILGNETPHLHAHLIPRYNSPREAHGITFIDPNPKGNYAPYPKQEVALEILLRIKDEIRKNLP